MTLCVEDRVSRKNRMAKNREAGGTLTVRMPAELAEALRRAASDLSVVRDRPVNVTDVIYEFLRKPIEALAEETRRQLLEYTDHQRAQDAKKKK